MTTTRPPTNSLVNALHPKARSSEAVKSQASLCGALTAALLLSIATSTAAPSKPLGAGAEDRDAAAVVRYMAEGGRTPAWAQAPALLVDLAAEARANGLTLPMPRRVAAELSAEQAAMLATLDLARALAAGAVLPSSVQTDWTIPVPVFDPDAALAKTAALADPVPWLRALAPSAREYGRLQATLGRYGAIVESGGWPVVPDGPTLRLGIADQRVPILQHRLKIEGDLSRDAPEGPELDTTTESAVRRFQARHGLLIDGSVGRETLTAMNVAALARYRQIAANMERWRWLPRPLPENGIVVNVAAADLQLFENGKTTLELRTIAGMPRYPTPVLSSSVVSLLLNPPWDIPTDIADEETRPMARRDPGYLEREGIVARDEGRRLRQLPGPRNALGRLKFEMPNQFDIYLHDTPRQGLFNRSRRFFSHGCIRVQHPLELASRLLHDDGGSTLAKLKKAIKDRSTRRIPLPSAVPISILYLTAFVDADGTVEFRDDVYGRDGPLIAALFPDLSGMRAAAPEQGLAIGCKPS